MAQTYRTSQGDMWDAIALRLWGDERLFLRLMGANPQHMHVVVFDAGVELAVPEMDVRPPAMNLPPWKR